jgi:hypothetical protein
VHDPGATSVNPPSRTTGRPLATRSGQRAVGAIRTASAKSASCHSERIRGDALHHASCAAWPTCAMAFPAVIGNSGLSQSRGVPSGTGPGGTGSSNSVPETCSRASSGGQPSTGTGGYTRISAVRWGTVIPGRARARCQAAPRARRTTLRIRASSQARIAAVHSPSSSVTRGSVSRVSTARAAPSSASVRAGGVARSTRTTSGRAYSGGSPSVSGCCAVTFVGSQQAVWCLRPAGLPPRARRDAMGGRGSASSRRTRVPPRTSSSPVPWCPSPHTSGLRPRLRR